jgi:hypothetical protein
MEDAPRGPADGRFCQRCNPSPSKVFFPSVATRVKSSVTRFVSGSIPVRFGPLCRRCRREPDCRVRPCRHETEERCAQHAGQRVANRPGGVGGTRSDCRRALEPRLASRDSLLGANHQSRLPLHDGDKFIRPHVTFVFRGRIPRSNGRVGKFHHKVPTVHITEWNSQISPFRFSDPRLRPSAKLCR